MSDDIIPTPETAALAAAVLRRVDGLGATRGVVLPLLEAIASGLIGMAWRPFCDVCDGDGFFEQGDDRTGETESEFCKPCKGTGLEPDPPGRKQRTAYDAMIEDAAEGGA